jgi:hypothetical protein
MYHLQDGSISDSRSIGPLPYLGNFVNSGLRASPSSKGVRQEKIKNHKAVGLKRIFQQHGDLVGMWEVR